MSTEMKTQPSRQRSGFAFVVCAIVACGACIAQPPRGVQTYNDPFEGPTRGFVLYLDRGQLTAVGATESRAGVELKVMVVATGDHRVVAQAGTTIDLQLGKDTRTATSTRDAAPVASVFAEQVITQWQVAATLTREQVEWLSTAPLESIRVTIANDPYILKLDARDARQVQANMQTLSAPAR